MKKIFIFNKATLYKTINRRHLYRMHTSRNRGKTIVPYHYNHLSIKKLMPLQII